MQNFTYSSKFRAYEKSVQENEEFFSPRGSTRNNASAFHTRSSPPKSLNPINLNSPSHSSSSDNSPSVVLNSSSLRSIASKSPNSLLNFPASLLRYIPSPPPREPRAYTPFLPSSSEDGARNSSPRSFEFLGIRRGPTPSRPPPPPLPPSPPPRRRTRKKMEEFKNDKNGVCVDADEKLGGCVRGGIFRVLDLNFKRLSIAVIDSWFGQVMLNLAIKYNKEVQEEDELPPEKLAIANVGRQDAKKHLEEHVSNLMSRC
ncbi:unnamed protein product [Fraxinus pennsylvanica]|uniref:26S proteasome regulatory subunit RPN11 C-terminal domain-containing protein n=1 Tax=Fraxinus pennsylvanica TaxID=56036 RepID=A0AAD2EC63_9LAMI|nr:unnamed protein product [Fraxinus pennsylvanica]